MKNFIVHVKEISYGSIFIEANSLEKAQGIWDSEDYDPYDHVEFGGKVETEYGDIQEDG